MRFYIKTKLALFLFLSFISYNSNCQIINFEIGDTLNVFSFNGLNLRFKPDVKTKILKILPYGSKVKVIEIAHRSFYNLREGKWLKVKYQDEIGFIFSGYLTKLELPNYRIPNAECNPFLSFINWSESIVNSEQLILEKNLKDKGTIDDEKIPFYNNWKTFKDGTEISTQNGYEYTMFRIYTTKFNSNDIINYLSVLEETIKTDSICSNKYNLSVGLDYQSDEVNLKNSIIEVYKFGSKLLCEIYHP